MAGIVVWTRLSRPDHHVGEHHFNPQKSVKSKVVKTNEDRWFRLLSCYDKFKVYGLCR